VGKVRKWRFSSTDMGHFLLLVRLGVVVFASTNLDDSFLLLGLFSDPRFHARQVVVG
jgi:hypothetical protein